MPHLQLPRLLSVTALSFLVTGLTLPGADARPPRDDDDHPSPKMRMAAPAMAFDAAELGATAGGAQDIGYYRDRVQAGEIPHAKTFTPEGLFSEHDLPLRSKPCNQLLCLSGEGTDVRLLAQPEVRHLAQIGFASGLNAKTFQRDNLNLVAVIDKSGSMSGQPLQLVKESLREVVAHLGPRDQISIVLYGDRSHVHLPPTPVADKQALLQAIESIQSAGSTAMEEGLKVGFSVAERSARSFQGKTRVMLFTDERPNVGRTDAGSFMAMAAQASRRGVGMTTVGVSVQFGAELATKISSVHGGNLFFFPDATKMRDVFEDEFDTMITELAHDLSLEVTPQPGLKIAGVYGIPGDMLKWKGDSISLQVSTIFLSRRKGAIYVAFVPDGSPDLPTPARSGATLGRVDLRYVERGGKTRRDRLDLGAVPMRQASLGLRRGVMLVDEFTALRRASELHHQANDQEGAYQIVHALAARFRQVHDQEMAPERDLVLALERSLAKRSGHAGEPGPGAVAIDTVSGLPPARR